MDPEQSLSLENQHSLREVTRTVLVFMAVSPPVRRRQWKLWVWSCQWWRRSRRHCICRSVLFKAKTRVILGFPGQGGMISLIQKCIAIYIHIYICMYFVSGNLWKLLSLLITNWQVPGRRNVLFPGMYKMLFSLARNLSVFGSISVQTLSCSESSC